MRQAGVSVPQEIVRVPEVWDEPADDREVDELPVRRGRITGTPVRRTAAPSRTTDPGPRVVGAPSAARSQQPLPSPIAVEVAQRYARALTLPTATTAPPAPRSPRRSRAAMRDRALETSRRPASDPAVDPAERVAGSGAVLEAEVGPPPPARPAERPRQAERPRPAERPRATSAQPSRAVASPLAADPVGGVPGRRTVTIRGRGAEREGTWSPYHSRRRPAVPAHEREGFRPDRAAMWAVLLGLLLVLVAATSSHAAVLAHVVH